MEKLKIGEHNGCIHTFSGKRFDFTDPKPEQIDIVDIAKGLSTTPHFRGQTEEFFSVAEHCLLTVGELGTGDPELRLAALLHDAAEAYTGDMPSPLKAIMPEFKKIEKNIQKVIFKKYDLDISLLAKVKEADVKAQQIEFDEFFQDSKSNRLHYYNPVMAFHKFTSEFNRLVELVSDPVIKYVNGRKFKISYPDGISDADKALIDEVNEMGTHNYDLFVEKRAESDVVAQLVKFRVGRLYRQEEAASDQL